jgi:DNA-binding CsgD family transcriptional regulator/Tfp pilus assembly protein PilF
MAMPRERGVVARAFVGREAAFDAVAAAYDSASRGIGQTVLVSGEAGIGKSRFVAEVRAHVEAAGGRFLQGNCFEQDSSVPFGPIVDVLRTLLLPRSRTATLTAVTPYAVELIKIVPELALWLPGVVPSEALNAAEEKRRLFSTLGFFLVEQAERAPTVLAIEDLHWADDVSRELVLFLSRRAQSSPLLVLLTYRSDDPRAELDELTAQLRQQRDAVSEIFLPPLSQDQVGALIRKIAALERPVRRDFVESLHRVTGGNPLFVEEVLAAYLTSGDSSFTGYSWDRRPLDTVPIPRSVSQALRLRVDRLTGPARETLEWSAVAGRYVDLRLLEAITGRTETELLELVHGLVDAQLLADLGDQFGFRHILIQQAVYAGLPLRQRAAFHQRIADLIEEIYPDRLVEYLADLAHHVYSCQDWPRVLTYAQRLAATALRLVAPHALVIHLSVALEAAPHVPDADVIPLYLDRGRAYHLLSDFEDAKADFEQAITLAQAGGDVTNEWNGVLALGYLWTERNYAEAGALYSRAVDLAGRLADPDAEALSQTHLAFWLTHVGEPVRAAGILHRAVKVAEQRRDKLAVCRALQMLSVAAAYSGNRRLSMSSLDRSVDMLRRSDDKVALAICLALRCVWRSPAGTETIFTVPSSLVQCIRDREEALALAESTEWRAGRAFVQFAAAWMLAAYGELGQALASAREAMEIATEVENRLWIVGAHNSLADARLAALDPTGAIEVLNRGLPLAYALGSVFYVGNMTVSLAQAHLQLGDLQAADRAIAQVQLVGDPLKNVERRRLLWLSANIALARHDPATALRLADDLSASIPAVDPHRPAPVPLLDALRGEALLGLGRINEAHAMLADAVRGVRVIGDVLSSWPIYRGLARVQVAQRHRQEVRNTIEAATDVIQRMADSIPDSSARERFRSAALGSLPTLSDPTPLQSAKAASGGLSRREREIADLVARGQATADISATLVISHRTVETHISNIYAKLGINSRAQLTAWILERQGLGPRRQANRPSQEST